MAYAAAGPGQPSRIRSTTGCEGSVLPSRTGWHAGRSPLDPIARQGSLPWEVTDFGIAYEGFKDKHNLQTLGRS